jgi:hypothetical protein
MVTKASATYTGLEERYYNQLPSDADHSQLVKFTASDDPNYISVRERLLEFVADLPSGKTRGA